MKFKIYLILPFLCILKSSFVHAQVLINEVASNNPSLIKDEDGDYPDWLELFNATNQAIQLLNYSLTDDSKNNKWTFPNFTDLLLPIIRTGFCLLNLIFSNGAVFFNR